MSATKSFYDTTILVLAATYGYTEAYLSSVWAEMVADGDPDWDLFVGITMERDW